MHLEEAPHLLDDVVEATGLDARTPTRRCCRAWGRRSRRPGARSPRPSRRPAGSTSRTRPAPMRVMRVSRPGSWSGSSRSTSARTSSGVADGPTFSPIGLAMRRREVDVRAVELAGALPHPHEVAGHVVAQPGPGVDAGEGALVVEDERLVAGVEIDATERLGVDAGGVHEGQRAVDLAGELLVARALVGLGDEVLVPRVHLAQVGVAALGEGTHEVQGGRRPVVGLDEPGRVVAAQRLVEREPVDHVAAVGRQAHAVAGLGAGGAGLGVLPGDPPDLHHRHRGAVGQHDGHLQDRARACRGSCRR